MILTGFTISALFLTIIFAIQYRMVKNPLGRKVGQSIMNMFMGITLILFGLNQFMFPDLTLARQLIGGLLIALGLLNLTMGYKNYRFYKSKLDPS